MRKKLFVLLVGISVFFGLTAGRQASAAVEVTGGYCDTTILFNSPIPEQTYKAGDTINFSGAFRVTSCGDGLFFNKITFFIAEDKDIPLKTVDACQSCLGASSSAYSDCNVRWCDQVQVLDTANYKVRKLGTIFPPDVHHGARPYWVAYDQTFTIPEDLDFWGPVRFYVQYSGTHWHSHWHWNITYQPGFIAKNNPPAVSNMTVSEGGPQTYCSVPPVHYFTWQYSDPDGDKESGFQFQVDDDRDFSSPEVNRPYTGLSAPNPSVNKQTVIVAVSPSEDQIGFHTLDYWRVRVWDKGGESSGWVEGPAFSTEPHPYPSVFFSWFPQRVRRGEKIFFSDQSLVYGDASKVKRKWRFEDGSPAVSNEQNPTVRFLSQGVKNIFLSVSDEDNLSCSASKTLGVGANFPLPFFRESTP